MDRSNQKGFTLVEVLVTMAIGMIILAGMVAVFVSQTNVSKAMKQKTEAMGDLFLASQIMQGELRGARSICWRSTGAIRRLAYRPLDSGAVLNCANVAPENGAFELRRISARDYRIYWKRPKDVSVGRAGTRYEEMIRGMMPDPDYVLKAGEVRVPEGLMVSDPANPDAALGGNANTWVVQLSSRYLTRENQINHLDLKFKVWPRNQ